MSSGPARSKGGVSLVRNLLSNSGGYIASIVLSFVVAPVTIHNLGDARYGIWSLIAEMVGYYSLLDLGVGGAVTYFVARYAAKDEHDKLHSTVSSAFWALSASGLIVVVIGLGIALLSPWLFTSPNLDHNEIRTVIIVMSCVIGVSLPMNTFSAMLGGFRRFDLINGIEVTSRVMVAAATYVLMRRGYGLLSLAAVQTLGRLLIWVFLLVASRRVSGELHLGPARFEYARLKELWNYGLSNLVGQIAIMIIYRVDLVVVGIFAGVQWVTYYTIGATLITSCSAAVSNITRVFTPQFSHLDARQDHDELLRFYFLGARLSGLVSCILAAGILIFGASFIVLWVGQKYVTGPWQYRSDVIMLLMLAAQLPRFMQSISWQLLYGTGRNRFLMWLNICEAAANLSLSILLVHYYGPAGVALGTLLPLMVTHLLVLPRYVLRSFSIPLREYIRRGIGGPILVGIAMSLFGYLLTQGFPPTNWAIFFTEVALTTVVGLACALSFGITAEDRVAALRRLGLGKKAMAG